MTTSRRLILASTLAASSVSGLSCAGVSEWSAKVYSAPNTRVHSNGHLYSNAWWAEAFHIPHEGAPWSDLGPCDEGTIGQPGEVDEASLVDCSGAFPYSVGATYPNPNTLVHHNNALYKNGYHANADAMPAAADVWSLQGQCRPGTAGAGPQGEIVDCTNVNEWTKRYAYATVGEKAHYEGRLYSVTSWSQGQIPGQGGNWKFLGTCAAGTDSLGPHEDPNELDPETEALLCACCRGCAENRVGNPVCHDEVASEDECLFSWCPKHNTFNEAECERIKHDQQLSWYTKEIVPDNKVWPNRIYIPYIDAGLAKQPNMVELAKEHGVKHFILAFITAESNTTECRGAFASVIPFRTGPTSWNGDKQGNDYLYDQLNELREIGGSITLSHGGANGIELADSEFCSDVHVLKNAYKEIVEFLKLSHIDFDIEGNAAAAVQREKGWKNRFEAVKMLVEEIPDLKVWWTLPILPTGLTSDGLLFIHDMMASGVKWDKFNVMTMDYGDDFICPGDKMHECEISAIENLAINFYNTAAELGLLKEYGWTSPNDVYPKLGSTPMLGLNDCTNERYTLDDARKSMNVWQTRHPIGIISNWSVQRDDTCNLDYVSVDCSSFNIQSRALEFMDIFAPYTSE